MTIGGVFLPLAFAAGFVSFLSPCVLPLVPGYLSAITGGVGEAGGANRRRRLGASLLFLVGFLAVFVALGASASIVGSALGDHRTLLNQVAGGFVVVMGVSMAVDVALPAVGFGQFGRAIHLIAAGRGGPVALGVAFAFCWTPCIGPVLASILALAGATLTLSDGVVLLFVYGLGLAVPFLLSALTFQAALTRFRSLRRHYRLFQLVGGVILVAMGVLLISDHLYVVNARAQQLLEAVNLDWWNSL